MDPKDKPLDLTNNLHFDNPIKEIIFIYDNCPREEFKPSEWYTPPEWKVDSYIWRYSIRKE